jgi:hypothetical protein
MPVDKLVSLVVQLSDVVDQAVFRVWLASAPIDFVLVPMCFFEQGLKHLGSG